MNRSFGFGSLYPLSFREDNGRDGKQNGNEESAESTEIRVSDIWTLDDGAISCSFEDLYRSAYNLAVTNHSRTLYHNTRYMIRQFLREQMAPLVYKADTPRATLETLLDCFVRHKKSMAMISGKWCTYVPSLSTLKEGGLY